LGLAAANSLEWFAKRLGGNIYIFKDIATAEIELEDISFISTWLNKI